MVIHQTEQVSLVRGMCASDNPTGGTGVKIKTLSF